MQKNGYGKKGYAKYPKKSMQKMICKTGYAKQGMQKRCAKMRFTEKLCKKEYPKKSMQKNEVCKKGMKK